MLFLLGTTLAPTPIRVSVHFSLCFPWHVCYQEVFQIHTWSFHRLAEDRRNMCTISQTVRGLGNLGSIFSLCPFPYANYSMEPIWSHEKDKIQVQGAAGTSRSTHAVRPGGKNLHEAGTVHQCQIDTSWKN